MKILINYIFNVAGFFLNDIEIKNSKIKYDNEEITSSIRRYILAHIKSLNAVLVDLKKNECHDLDS
jgi:hypothetical protein